MNGLRASQRRAFFRTLPLLCGSLLALLPSCGSDRPNGVSYGEPHLRAPTLCLDGDRDGYGVGCAKGNDCDDADPAVTFECTCTKPNTGCACNEAGRAVTCGRAYAQIGSQLMCGEGVTTCADGRWGECILAGDIALAQNVHTQSLGSSSTCANNPCDPGCTTFVDDTTNLMVDSGLQVGADGIALAGDLGGGSAPPVGGGFGCSGGRYPAATGVCTHHVCETGGALDPHCDDFGGSSTTTTLFSDTFEGGNAKGWSLDPSWAIGAATSSSGHTTGNADPATDVTATADNQIAGTVLGGNIGGPTVIFSDTFGNLNNWSQTGDGNWASQSRSSSSGYPASGSGSPIGHASNCDAGCTLTLKNALDLSGYDNPTLTLLRYVDSNLDAGEYLGAEVFNGTSWSSLASWASPAADDSNWHAESFSLASFRVPGFKLRFVSSESQPNEHVEVDEVAITAPPLEQPRYLVSPVIDASGVNGRVTLQFSRWLNVEDPAARRATVDVWDGSAWVNVWTNTAIVSDSAWSTQSLDISPQKHAGMRVRFGWSGAATSKVSGWNLDDVSVTGVNNAGGTSFCVAAICAQDPTCCGASWHAGCLARVKDACKIDCSRDTATNTCVACYKDATLTLDFDGDGFSPAQGDCRECDPQVNPGAYDFAGNGADEDCDGTVDNAPASCDGALTPGGDAWNHAKAMGLCTVAQNGKWGVVSADFVRADGVTPCTDSLQREITASFGGGNSPTEGGQMSVFSSGAARASAESGYVQPNGHGYWANTSSTPAHAVPAASGCNAGTAGYDSCGMKLTIKAPTNANSFAFNFDFFTSEYPEWQCTSFNDAFVAYYGGSLNTQADKNISFDSVGNPVSVNNGLFTIPGGSPPPASGSHPQLNGTGFDGVCSNSYSGSKYMPSSICGGATGWLNTTAPVKPGEQITLQFAIWDTGDRQWDSTVLLDNFRWSPTTASIETGVYSAGTGGEPTLVEAPFIRDYDMSTSCKPSQRPQWSLWSWSASTPADSKIEFFVATASTAAGLATAPEDPLEFSNPPGPSALAGQHAVAHSSAASQTGAASILNTLAKNNRRIDLPFLRMRSQLIPSSNKHKSPSLSSWNLQASCADVE